MKEIQVKVALLPSFEIYFILAIICIFCQIFSQTKNDDKLGLFIIKLFASIPKSIILHPSPA